MTGHNLVLAIALFAASAVAGYLFYDHRQAASAAITTPNAHVANADTVGTMRPDFS